ncbi:MAG: response regulator [Verrucomicrobia bacterium]|nr:response regulator [Verrucomicrobiota bacterium]MCH8513995.1 response regulator [Kiritimatiellia bacterium]
MSKGTICIVEDEEDIREILEIQLKREGYDTFSAETGEKGLRLIREHKPRLVLLDLMLPGMDGFDVCRAMRSEKSTRAIPVIMLTARGEEADVITGLEIGADDYITKPFSPRIVMSRIKSVLRRGERAQEDPHGILEYGEIVVDQPRHLVKVHGEPVDLTATEYKLLVFLCKRPGWVFTRQQIVDNVRGEDYAVTERSVDVQVVGLRKKLADQADLIETVRGVGYRARELS